MLTGKSVTLQIAGIDLELCCRDAELTFTHSDLYLPFFEKRLLSSGVPIPVHITSKKLPDLQYAAKIFEGADSWSLHLQENDYFLSYFTGFSGNSPLCVAQFSKSVDRITIYCSNLQVTGTKNGASAIMNPVRYPLDQLLLMHILSLRQGMIVHAAGVTMQNRCFLFPGKSGAGKSTIARLLSGREDTRLMSDDRVILRETGDGIHAFGTPWAGEAMIADNISAPLGSVIFIHHGTENRIVQISAKKAAEKLMPVISIPWYDPDMLSNIFSFIEHITTSVPAYDFFFKPDNKAADHFQDFFFKNACT